MRSRPDEALGETLRRWPKFLSDGQHYLYLSGNSDPDKSGIYVESLRPQGRKLLLNISVQPVYAPPGYLMFYRGRSLFAQSIDERHFQLVGEPVLLTEDLVSFSSPLPIMAYWSIRRGARGSASLRGMTVREGGCKTLASPVPSGRLRSRRTEGCWRSSGSSLSTQTCGLWTSGTLELHTGIASKITFDANPKGDLAWAPDSKRIVVGYAGKGLWVSELREIDVSTKQSNVLYAGESMTFPDDWSPDGGIILYTNNRTAWLLPLLPEQSSKQRKPKVLVDSLSPVDEFHFSPDGRRIAYQSAETGEWEIFVFARSSPGEKRRVSRGGGTQPLWRGDGKELFYLSPKGTVMAVEMNTGDTIQPGIPKPLFEAGPGLIGGWNYYAVTRDGSKFLVNHPINSRDGQIGVVLNWTAALRK